MSKVPINFRIEPELKAALEAAAQDSGRSPSEMYRDVAWACVRAPAGSNTATAVAGVGYNGGTSQERVIDLATWLSRELQVPKAIAAAKIRMGLVTVAGEIHNGLTLDGAFLSEVAVDGVRVIRE